MPVFCSTQPHRPLTATLKGMKGSFSERYAWGSAGILLGISFCVTMLYLLATANLPR